MRWLGNYNPNNLQSFFGAHWHPRPESFLKNGCSQCNEIGFVQIVKQTVKKTAFGLGWFIGWWESSSWQVDSGIPYPFNDARQPNLPSRADPMISPIAMADVPEAILGVLGDLNHFSQEFETCVVCLDGIEGPATITTRHMADARNGIVDSYDDYTVYGCIRWEHVWTLQADGTHNVTQRITAGPANSGPGVAPSDVFNRAIRTYTTEQVILMEGGP